jgi:hypothetical protein
VLEREVEVSRERSSADSASTTLMMHGHEIVHLVRVVYNDAVLLACSSSRSQASASEACPGCSRITAGRHRIDDEKAIETMTISGTRQFTIGSEVLGSDGVCGELTRVVVDPIARVLTHLVVEPPKRWSMGRLVPIDLVASSGEQIRLRCTNAEFDELDQADVTEFFVGGDDAWNYEQDHVLSLPYYALVMNPPSGMSAASSGTAMDMGMSPISYDRVPVGDVEVRRGAFVHATDGRIGRVHGLVVDPGEHRITHVLLDEGHLWGEKEVAIPIGAVTGLDDGVQLNLSKAEVRDLPPVDFDRRDA